MTTLASSLNTVGFQVLDDVGVSEALAAPGGSKSGIHGGLITEVVCGDQKQDARASACLISRQET